MSRWLAQTLITVLIPPLLVLIAARLVMTPLFLSFEYNRADFPEDVYGLTREERLEYAPYALNYLLNGEPISYLGDLRFDSGLELFNERELGHMEDVKVVTQAAFGAAIFAGLLIIALGVLLRRDRLRLAAALRNGAILTLALVAAIALTAIFNWEFFFTEFHRIFFESGTWQFLYSDTLIRLFPEQFWFDAALTIGGLTIISALVVFFITFRIKST